MLNTIRENIADLIAPELKKERRRLERLAMTDDLTGLANARALQLALPTAERDDLTAIVLFDANNFGRLNKHAGHSFGNVIIKQMADCIRRAADCYGYGERVFRFGGDEFVVICPTRFATLIRDHAELYFGDRFPAIGVSLSGVVAGTLAAADAEIQQRKMERKNETKN